MGTEIERKFLVNDDTFKTLATGTRYRQGYLNSTKERVVRVRTIDGKGFLTIKGLSTGATRVEYEYEIPETEAHEILHTLCVQPLIEKIRYQITVTGAIWIIDEFLGENKGLVLAEIELQSEDQPIILPDWVETEVTGDPRYYNVQLVENPYSKWNKENGQNG